MSFEKIFCLKCHVYGRIIILYLVMSLHLVQVDEESWSSWYVSKLPNKILYNLKSTIAWVILKTFHTENYYRIKIS